MPNIPPLMQHGWDVEDLLYYGRHPKPLADKLGARLEPDLDKFLAACDVVRAHPCT